MINQKQPLIAVVRNCPTPTPRPITTLAKLKQPIFEEIPIEAVDERVIFETTFSSQIPIYRSNHIIILQIQYNP
uniref:Uncharacterized protein n=1 Tax=Romanomermis culicivorax TaxID=13658 RepID=A0A915JB75_ROMCU